ncbi:hypothetical protein CYMTET_32396 [Cymbomonas tetramitiformis]|uniref:Tetratricopeptide repeat protein n=1 Tax=Cymbomonas tetramitiformis TaxID=36881 RepID=A0AAE0FF55_9CHLO|nr:hypothetical protein CYMTET_32396 [Cymbomonas tetramitiformis]
MQLDVPLAESFTGLANQLLGSGQHPQARAMAEKAVALTPKSSAALKVLGYSLRHLGLHDQGREVFETLVRHNPKDPEGLANLGLAQSHTGRNKEAVDSFRAAIALHPRFINAYVALGKHLQSIHHTSEAIEVFEEAQKLDPDSIEIRHGLMQAISDTCDWPRKERIMPRYLLDVQDEVQRGGASRAFSPGFGAGLAKEPPNAPPRVLTALWEFSYKS